MLEYQKRNDGYYEKNGNIYELKTIYLPDGDRIDGFVKIEKSGISDGDKYKLEDDRNARVQYNIDNGVLPPEDYGTGYGSDGGKKKKAAAKKKPAEAKKKPAAAKKKPVTKKK
jgi:hypothetical protein